MLKLAKYLVHLGRKNAYAEIITELETLQKDIIASREGLPLRRAVGDKIERLRKIVADEEVIQ